MYVLIKWMKEGKVSLGLCSYVKDKKMLYDPKRVGLVEHGEIGRARPKGGFKTFEAQILRTEGKFIVMNTIAYYKYQKMHVKHPSCYPLSQPRQQR